jgi:hypothetical protein
LYQKKRKNKKAFVSHFGILIQEFGFKIKEYFGFKSKDSNQGDFQIQSKVLNGF